MRILLLVLAALVPRGGCFSSSLGDPKPRTRRANGAPTTKHENPLWESTWTDKLKQDLLLNYDKFARPMQHTDKTSVNLDTTLIHIELDEKKSIMSVHCWLKLIWQDEKLKWNPSKYNGLNELHLANHEVWQPDVLPFNSASGSTIDHYGNTNMIVYGNGTVLWVPPTLFHVFCKLDFTTWPFDTQVCHMKIGSWTYNGEEIDLVNEKDGKTTFEAKELIPNSEWEFIKMNIERNTVMYPCCPQPYIDITFYITIRRHYAIYKALIITPASAVVFMTLAIFWIPPTSGDKITLGGAAVITTCLFILYFTQKMPTMAGNTPYIVTFYSRCLYLISLALVIAVFVINLANNPKTSSLPWLLKKYLNGWLGKCLFIKTKDQKDIPKAEEMIDSQPVLSDQGRHLSDNSKSNQNDWILLATAIDRIFFLLYCLAFVILALTYWV